jgi:PTH1 family peptidyl-tRNA hydrolase
MSKYLIIGLGNVGIEYAHTRHNIGFDILDAFVIKHNGFFKNARLADIAEIKWKGKIIICLKPTTYVNLSGKAFKYWLDKEKVPLENTLTIVDDLAIPLNKLKLRPGGSSGGHNGLADIELTLGTNKYPKLRFGIGNNFPKGMQPQFVLSKWFPEEVKLVEKKIAACIELIEQFCTIGIEKTMNLANCADFSGN